MANTFVSLVELPGHEGYGMLISGWGFSGFDTTNPLPEQVSVRLLAPGSEGLYDATSTFISDPVTNGAGSIVVADFNQDGKEDILLPAHNESPFAPLPSTAYMSTPQGTFEKVVLPDKVAAHHSSLVQKDGPPLVLASTYMGISSPLYEYRDGQFVITPFPHEFGTDHNKNVVLTGAASVVASFDGSGDLQLVRADVTHYNADWSAPTIRKSRCFPIDWITRSTKHRYR